MLTFINKDIIKNKCVFLIKISNNKTSAMCCNSFSLATAKYQTLIKSFLFILLGNMDVLSARSATAARGKFSI